MNRLQEIEARLAAIKTELGQDNADIDKLEKEVNDLKEERTALMAKAEKRKALLDGIATGGGTVIEESPEKRDAKPEANAKAEAEKRGKALLEKRSVTIASTGVILPAHQATDIKSTFNEVSSLLDRVNVKNLLGGESFKQPYMTGYGTGGYTTEGGDPTDAEATFGYATIGKTKLTAYAEDSEELVKLPAANYDAEVQKGISIAIRKKITKEILVGDGESGHFVGIFDDGATAIDADTDIDFAEIDENTLDTIIYGFGGDENVEDISVLVLNKLDLKAFAMLRDSNGRKIHDVKPSGNVGTIDGIPYIINSACKAISSSATTSGQYCMAYGPLSNYTMAIFSNLEIGRSTDYKFKEGMIAHKGVIFAGGNVTAENGFLRVKRT